MAMRIEWKESQVRSGYLRVVVGGGLNARVAQSVERSAVNRKVGGSNPPVSDIFTIRQNIILP